jgi:PAS domain S-box-containing protein
MKVFFLKNLFFTAWGLILLFPLPGLCDPPVPSFESFFFQKNPCASQLLQKHGSIMLLIDPATGHILDANAAASRFYAYPHLVGKNIKEINQLTAQEVEAEMERARLLNKNFFRFRHLLADGRIRDVEVYAYPITIQEKDLLFSIVVDITDRIHAEQELRQKEKHIRMLISSGLFLQFLLILLLFRSHQKRKDAEQRLRAILDHSPLLISEMDPSGHYLLCNEKTAQFFGRTQEEIRGKSFHELLPPETADRFMKRITRVLDAKAPIFVEDTLRTDHGERSYETVLFPLLDTEGHIRSIAGISHDVTEMQQKIREKECLETQLLDAQRMESIGMLAGGIAHDFNNILFPIMGYAEMLLMEIPEDHPQHRKLDEIYKAALRARDLTQQILTFARRENHEPSALKVQPIIKEVLKFVRATIPSSIEIRPYIQNDCRPIHADPTQIHQIVMNLVTNAFHAMEDAGGELRIHLQEVQMDQPRRLPPAMTPGSYVRLSVADTGLGIPQALLDRIFDPFFTTKPKGKGTGMGLSVVRGIVQRCGGFIQVDSEEGKGSTFCVYFPVAEASATPREKTQTAQPLQGGNEHILLVDDEKAIVTLQEKILESLGYRVTACTDSGQAFDLFRAAPADYDLILTDMHMPGMSGDRLAQAILAIRPDIPVLLCTGFSEHTTPEKLAASGIGGLLIKPITARDLAAKIRELLDLSSGKSV